ncbi:MAG: magnesium transporter CorA family protein [Burkholderiaceae bacterium]
MQIFTFEGGVARKQDPSAPQLVPPKGVAWIDCTHDEVNANPEAWRDQVAQLAGFRVFDLHLIDCVNLQHPSFFDTTSDYDMVVFRKLSMGGELPLDPAQPAPEKTGKAAKRRALPQALAAIATRPITFFCGDRVLVTVRSAESRVLNNFCAKLQDVPRRGESNGQSPRGMTGPEEVMLRILNVLVDSYLDLRVPLTQQLDRWQRELLDPRRAFSDWTALLEARIEIRKLEQLSEEQYDALQEFRDSVIDNIDGGQRDILLVRINDVMEHVSRVLNHARRMENSAESAVQLHFSAMSHRTNQIVRTLTVITAIFAPLTLITGVFGMNFEHMPLLKDREGFWWTIGGMAFVAVVLLIYFRAKRYLSERRG